MTTEEQKPEGAAVDVAQQATEQAVAFSPEQQRAIDKLLSERLKRDRAKWEEGLAEKGRAEAEAAEAQRLQDEQKWQELARKHEGKAAEEAARVKELAARLERADAVVGQLLEARKAGLPDAVVKVLDGRDVYDQLEIVNAFLAAQPAAAGQPAQRPATTATPPAQGSRGLTPEERRARAARTF